MYSDLERTYFLPKTDCMQVDNYTTFKGINLDTGISKHFEQILLIIVACLGLLGSVYIFADNTLLPGGPSESNIQLFTTTPDMDADLELGDLDKYFEISGEKKVGEKLTFTFLGDLKASRYVLEMGDEMRFILTSQEFDYTYQKAGKYRLELKEIKRGLITTLASKKIKIKG